MNPWLRRADVWLFPTGAARALGDLRILTGLFAVIYLAVRLRAFLVVADAAPSRFAPVGVLSLLDEPLADPVVFGLAFVALGLGVAYTAGAWFRVSGPAFALVLLVLSTYRSSWGQILWIENLLVLHVLIVGFSRSADALTLRGRRSFVTAAAARYGSPVRLAALVTVATYLLACVAKFRLSGIEWMFGDNLRNHVAYSVRVDLLGTGLTVRTMAACIRLALSTDGHGRGDSRSWRHRWPCSAGACGRRGSRQPGSWAAIAAPIT
jgi:hypothetical protein